MKGYSLPPELDNEINQLEALIAKYKKGEASAIELKAHRVPFGVYEQRKPDTYMVRIRCAGGIIIPEQLEKVAAIALEYSNSDIHLTSRQELQIHYVKLEDIIAVIKKLKTAGLATRGGGGNTVRNIAAADDAGIDPDEEFDVSAYVTALTTRLIAESDSWNLPRKFKIAFSGSAEDKGYATISDLGFIARKKEAKPGFRVYCAGGLGAKSATGKLLLDFIDADQAYPIAKALKNIFYKYGNRKNKHAARMRFLWNNLGEEEFRKKFEEEYIKVKQEGFLALAIDEQENKKAAVNLKPQEPNDPKDFILWKKRFVKAQKQPGLLSVLIPIELGFIASERAAKLALFLKPFGSDVLRMTRDQNFLVRNIPLDYLGATYNFLKEQIPEASRPSLYGKILTCAGASTCQLGICLSRQAGRALIDELGKSNLDLDKIGDIKINISGCPNSCGHHPAADLGFSGKALRNGDRLYPAYNVLAGAVIRDGKTKLAEHCGEIPAKALVLLVKDLLRDFLSKAGRFADFGEYIADEGKNELKGIISRYSKPPAFNEDKNYYFDWGADTLFSLAERKAGECSAGFFDLLEMDLNNIKKTQALLAQGGKNAGEKENLLAELVFYSSRALLITRGLDAKSKEEVYTGFLKYFIETGLIDASFRDLVITAGHGDIKTVLTRELQALNLAQAVQGLYETMDNSYNFPRPSINAPGEILPEAEKAAATVTKDLRGVVCPLNFVKTKVELAKIKSGEILEIWLDDGEPIENVPGSVKEEGHKIISQKKTKEYWSLVIEKK